MKNVHAECKPNYIQIGEYNMHYLDEGKGEVILMVHGIPEWSVLYAGLIRELSKDYRCIVPDHLGFGLSDKPTDMDFTPRAHAHRLARFIHKLGLQHIHLVVHDYGGPIGMGALVDHPALFRSLSISNTWLWNLHSTPSAKALKMMSGALGKWLYLNYGFSVKFMSKNGFADKRKFQEVKDVFMYPHQTKRDRYANYRLMLEMLPSGDYFDDTLRQLKALDLPLQVTWGMKDRFFDETFLERWKAELSRASIRKINGAGHFPQIESPQEMATHIRSFVG